MPNTANTIKFSANTIILGFTGPIAGGCSYISSMIPEITGGNYHYFKLSDIIRRELTAEGIDNPDIKQLQDKGNKLRKQYGPGCLVKTLFNSITDGKIKLTAPNIIIDGIKNEGEVELLKSFANAYLFSVHAERDVRSKRAIEAGIFKDDDAFQAADRRDEFENSTNGQQVKRCNYLADIIIVNDAHTPSTMATKHEDFVKDIYRHYIKLIENNIKGEYSPEISPSINEMCMTSAYAQSMMSSCLKRKVGSVIIDLEDISKTTDGQDKVVKYPCIVSSGFNEVPMGSQKCIFHNDFEKCYRDHLQEEHAEKIKFCPSCGEGLNVKTTCPTCKKIYNRYVKFCPTCRKEIKWAYRCPKCEIKVFEEHLPGDKKSPGKLLDMCRSLHAEEMAILMLAKRSGNQNKNLVLYVTTQPCNLCANKIVSAGIKKVVYAEPYTMKEAAETLTNGDVKLERFEGVKSTAFFKLYH